jgi:hypothetical protein
MSKEIQQEALRAFGYDNQDITKNTVLIQFWMIVNNIKRLNQLKKKELLQLLLIPIA